MNFKYEREDTPAVATPSTYPMEMKSTFGVMAQ